MGQGFYPACDGGQGQLTYTQAEMVRLQDENVDGAVGKHGGKVFSIQLFSFKKLLFRATDSTWEVLAFNGLETLNIQTNGNSIKAYS